MNGVIESCYFCNKQWGHCTCSPAPDDVQGFWHDDIYIKEPGLSVCGRFFVNPNIYYGEQYSDYVSRKGQSLKRYDVTFPVAAYDMSDAWYEAEQMLLDPDTGLTHCDYDVRPHVAEPEHPVFTVSEDELVDLHYVVKHWRENAGPLGTGRRSLEELEARLYRSLRMRGKV